MAHSEIHNTGNIDSGKDVLLTTEDGKIFNVGTTKAGSAVDIDAADYLLNTGDIEAESSVTIKAVDYLLNSGSIKAGADITVTSKTSDLINAGNYYTSNGTIKLTAKEDILNLGVMETAKGNIEITTDNGSIYNQQGADLLTGDGEIILHAKSQDATYYYYNDEGVLVPIPAGAVVKAYTDNERFGGQYIMLDGQEYDVVKNGSVFNAGDALAMNGTIRFISDYGDVTNYDDFDTLSTAESGVFETKYNGYSIATGNVEISAKNGTLFNSKDIEAGGDVMLTAAEGLINFAYNVYAGKNITLTATSGDLLNSATLESYAGNVTLRAENGNVINGVDGQGKGDIITYGGNVTLSANGYGTDGKAGSVTNYGDIIAINANAEDKAATGSITLISEHGDVDNFDDFNTYKQDGQYYKDYEAGKHQSIDSEDASYNLANNNLTLSAKEGHLYTDKDYLVALGNVSLEAKTGLESFGKTIYAGRDIMLNATDGNLVNQGNIIAQGNVVVRSLNGSVINDGHVESIENNIVLDGYSGVVSEVGAANLKALNGSISIVSIYGDINVDELFAGEMAVAGTKQGNIKLGAISGKDVILYTEDEKSVIRGYDKNAADKEQDEEPLKVKVKEHLFLQGNNFGGLEIESSGRTGTLLVDANGVGGDVMQGSLKMNVEGDVRFTKLNLTNAEITVSGKLGIDRLHVAGKGIFTSQGYVTGVYGVAPVHDASNALYFDLGEGKEEGSMLKLRAEEFRAVREGSPEELRALKTMRELRERLEEAGRAEETFGKDNCGWMNLYVDGPRDQRSNGLLLHIDTYYHSGNQRWSAEDLITKLVDFKPIMSYNAHFGDAYGLFNRYNIIELPEEEKA